MQMQWTFLVISFMQILLFIAGLVLIIWMMKNTINVFRDEMHQKPEVALTKVFLYEAVMIKGICLLIVSTNNNPSVYSISLAIAAAIYCSVLLMIAASKIGLQVKKEYYKLPAHSRTILMNFIRPWVVKVEKELPWYQAPYNAMNKILDIK